MKSYRYIREIYNSKTTVLKLREIYKIRKINEKHYEVYNKFENIKLCTITKECLESRFEEIKQKC